MSNTDILAATGNAHKLQEFRDLLAPAGIRVLTPDDVGGIPEVEESGDTFLENAVLKAEAAAAAAGVPAFADDSGLEVAALDGEPGIYSARYAGTHGDAAANNRKLLACLKGRTDRQARFVCVIAAAAPAGLVGTVEGVVRGTIADEPSGDNGFGYDPLFIPDGHDLTFGILPAAVKAGISHRARALEAALEAGLFERAVEGGVSPTF